MNLKIRFAGKSFCVQILPLIAMAVFSQPTFAQPQASTAADGSVKYFV
jgi:hypothetical protein